MGLDDVELIMLLEEVYGIEIPESFLESRTDWHRLGTLFQCVLDFMEKKRAAESEADPTVSKDPSDVSFSDEEKAAMWEGFRAVVAGQMGLGVEEVTPDADLYKDLGAGA